MIATRKIILNILFFLSLSSGYAAHTNNETLWDIIKSTLHSGLTFARNHPNWAQFFLSIPATYFLCRMITQNTYHQASDYNLLSKIIADDVSRQAQYNLNQPYVTAILREQLEVIKGLLGQNGMSDITRMRIALETSKIPADSKSEIEQKIDQLERMNPHSPGTEETRSHLEWTLSMPWAKETETNLDLEHIKTTLDEDHYGLKEIKNRILDFISVEKLTKDDEEKNTPILCFVGPPGTGKTSFGESIAKAINRTYARISLGGVHDESEIRGHRSTYIGAMPGQVMQAVKKAGSCNPVIVLDEIDKLSSNTSFHGNPAAAMLEVLDPKQNRAFRDNYLGIPFDLSKVMFIATANSIETIPRALLDRLEIIELSGYTVEEKICIARKHLVQQAARVTGLTEHAMYIDDMALQTIITDYTRESGVRELERLIRKVYSKVARTLVEQIRDGDETILIDVTAIATYLGAPKYIQENVNKSNSVGIVNGLAWTACGGETLNIEATIMPGTGKLLLTGQLGNVMKESARIALSYARSQAKRFNIDEDMFCKHDLHIHVPAGAIPKDGPSAGITLLIATLSAFTNRPVNAQYAMTGELNLRGEIMPIGGLKEKILAAIRNKITHVIIPDANRNDLDEIKEIADGVDVILTKHVNEIIDNVLLPADA